MHLYHVCRKFSTNIKFVLVFFKAYIFCHSHPKVTKKLFLLINYYKKHLILFRITNGYFSILEFVAATHGMIKELNNNIVKSFSWNQTLSFMILPWLLDFEVLQNQIKLQPQQPYYCISTPNVRKLLI